MRQREITDIYKTEALSISFERTDESLDPIAITFSCPELYEAFFNYVDSINFTYLEKEQIEFTSFNKENLTVTFKHEYKELKVTHYLIGKFLLEVDLDWPQEYVDFYGTNYLAQYKMSGIKRGLTTYDFEFSGFEEPMFAKGCNAFMLSTSRWGMVSIPSETLKMLHETGEFYKNRPLISLLNNKEGTLFNIIPPEVNLIMASYLCITASQISKGSQSTVKDLDKGVTSTDKSKNSKISIISPSDEAGVMTTVSKGEDDQGPPVMGSQPVLESPVDANKPVIKPKEENIVPIDTIGKEQVIDSCFLLEFFNQLSCAEKIGLSLLAALLLASLAGIAVGTFGSGLIGAAAAGTVFCAGFAGTYVSCVGLLGYSIFSQSKKEPEKEGDVLDVKLGQ